MQDLVKAAVVGLAAVYASEYASEKLAANTDTETTKSLYKFGGAAAGAYLAFHFLPKLT